MVKVNSKVSFPLHGALFLPSATRESSTELNYLATIESVMPILDVAITDAHRKYLSGYTNVKEWLKIGAFPLNECQDQKTAAWQALTALKWASTGLDLSLGPSCDYLLASINRILSYSQIPMVSNGGFSDYFSEKHDSYLTRLGPITANIKKVYEELLNLYGWKKLQLHYQKSFWENELLEAGLCKNIINVSLSLN
uniref:ANF_receptor domain-containing protein n=1 Tax=Rhabditophanes sp. KR3021 TaxID=114890 RepID=A0AC35U327_9BILA